MAILRKDGTFQIESIENLIHTMAYLKYPFLSMFMNSDPQSPSFMGKITDTDHKWTEKRLNTCRGELQAAITDSDTTIYELNQYTHYIDGKSIIRIGDEFISVTTAGAYDSTHGHRHLTVVRGWDSTTAVAHDAGEEIIIINLFPENYTPTTLNSAQYGAKQTNYTEIFYDLIQASRTSQAIKAIGNEFNIDAQLANCIPALLQQYENAMIYGRKYFDGTDTRMMGGMFYWIDQYTDGVQDSGGAQFTMDMLAQDVHQIVKNGADPSDLAMACGAGVLKTIEDKKASIVQETMKVNGFDYKISTIRVPGDYIVKVLPHALIYPKQEYTVFPQQNVKCKALTPLAKEDLAKVGDGARKQAVMEATGEFHNFAKGSAIRRKNVR